MALKWSNGIWFCLFVLGMHFPMQAQIIDSTIIYQSETYVSEQSFDPSYHFEDSEILTQQNKPLKQSFSDSMWQAEVKNKNFEELKEESENAEEAKPLKKQKTWSFSPALKYLWLIPAIFLLMLILYKIMPYLGQKNIKNTQKKLIVLDDLEEEDIKSLPIDSLLEEALKKGDYKLAYRIKYLSVLKALIDKNLLLYKKEKTNYEYVVELSGKPVYESFRLLTFNFDGIWYGELGIDSNKYHELLTHFDAFNLDLKRIE